jgi:hypothetical protein
MNLCAACVLPEDLEGGRLAHKDKQEALSSAKRQLRDYVKGLYAAGQGEWDSPTYLMFDLHGMLNIYDFSSDPELRLLAAAALDWFTAAYALKYRDGIFAGPNQRGYYDKAVNSIADQTGWLWWGSSVNPDPGSFYFAIHPATSSWKPNAILTKLARKDVPGLPVTFQNTKPNYWFGHGVSPKAGEYSESLHVSKSFTLGSLWNGFGGQITRFHLVANGPQPLALTGGHPRKSDHTGKRLDELTFRDGGGRYDQSIQTGPLYVSMSRIPEDEPIDYSFVSLPEGITPKKIGDLWVLRFGDAWVAVRPLGRESELADRPLSEKEASAREKAVAAGKSEPVPQILKMSGRPTGFALIAGESADWPSEEDFVRWVSNTYRWDDSKFQTEMTLGIRLCEEREIVMTHDAESSRARVTGLKAPAGAVYDGPFVKLKDQVLEISDGSKGYAVDFRGDLPVYRELP